MTRLRLLMMAGGLAVAAFACGDDPAPAAAPPPAAAAAADAPRPKPAASADAGTDAAEPVQYTYSYNPVGKRDPFRSPIDEPKKPGEKGVVESGVCPEPLCQFDLEQLTLVAVVSGDANPVAMLEDANKVGHIIRRNTKVGKQGGKVSQILRDCIEVTEFFMTPDGKKVPNRVQICVKKDEKVDAPIDLLNGKAVE